MSLVDKLNYNFIILIETKKIENFENCNRIASI